MIIPELIQNMVGIDKEIQRMQSYLQNNNVVELVFGKAEKIYDEKKNMHVVYVANNEYADVLQNDNIQSHIIFYVHDETKQEQFFENFSISVICFVDLHKKYPLFKHNAQENIINELKELIIKNGLEKWTPKTIKRGATRSLEDFNFQINDITHLAPFFTFSLEFDVKILNNNNTCLT